MFNVRTEKQWKCINMMRNTISIHKQRIWKPSMNNQLQKHDMRSCCDIKLFSEDVKTIHTDTIPIDIVPEMYKCFAVQIFPTYEQRDKY